MQSKEKAKEIIQSRNALVTIIGIVFSMLATAGVYVSHTPEEMYDIVSREGSITAAIVVLTYALNLVAQVVTKKVSWSFFQDRNVLAGIVTIISLILGSATNEEGAAVVATLVTNTWNFISHAQQPPKNANITN